MTSLRPAWTTEQAQDQLGNVVMLCCKIKYGQKGWGCSSTVERWLGTCDSLHLISSIQKINKMMSPA